VAVTTEFAVKVIVQVNPFGKQPAQATPVALPLGTAVRVTGVPLPKAALQDPGQLIPAGELVTDPVPLTLKRSTGLDPPEPVPVKHTTLAFMLPVTIAPDELRPPELEFV
jgi:hypothetical protein